MVKNSEIIAIFNLHHNQSQVYTDYILKYQDKYEIIDASGGEDYYSAILTPGKLFLSSISSITLKKRIEEGFLGDAVYSNL